MVLSHAVHRFLAFPGALGKQGIRAVGLTSRRGVTHVSACSPAGPPSRASKAKGSDDPWACQTEGKLADLKRRLPVQKCLIADCGRLAVDLDQEARNEKDRAKVPNDGAIASPSTPRRPL
jgi:hypothetical protein